MELHIRLVGDGTTGQLDVLIVNDDCLKTPVHLHIPGNLLPVIQFFRLQ